MYFIKLRKYCNQRRGLTNARRPWEGSYTKEVSHWGMNKTLSYLGTRGFGCRKVVFKGSTRASLCAVMCGMKKEFLTPFVKTISVISAYIPFKPTEPFLPPLPIDVGIHVKLWMIKILVFFLFFFYVKWSLASGHRAPSEKYGATGRRRLTTSWLTFLKRTISCISWFF